MKKNLLVLLISLTCVSVSAQKLTMDDILNFMRIKDVGTIDDLMKSKTEWTLAVIEEPKSGEEGVISYGYNFLPGTTKALAQFMIFYDENMRLTDVTLQLGSEALFNEYIKAMNGYGVKLIKTVIEDHVLIKIYRGANFTFIIRTFSVYNPNPLHRPPVTFIQIYYNTDMNISN